MIPSSHMFSTIHADSSGADGPPGAASRALATVTGAVRVQDNELKRWRRTFDTHAKTVVSSEKCVSSFACCTYEVGRRVVSTSILTPCCFCPPCVCRTWSYRWHAYLKIPGS